MPVFISFIGGALLFYLFPYFPLSSVVAGTAAAACLFIRKGRFLLLPMIALGVLYALLRFSPQPDLQAVWNRQIRMTGGFVGTGGGTVAKKFAVDRAFDEETGEQIEELRGRKVGIFSEGFEPVGDSYELLVKTGRDRTRNNPGSYGEARIYGNLLKADEIREGKVSPAGRFDRYRQALNRFVGKRFDADTAGLVAAITTGDETLLSGPLRDAFSVSGLAHILSISGTHFGLFSVILFTLFVFLVKRLPHGILLRLTFFLTPSQAAALLCVPFMLFYLGLSGASVPAVRSFVVVTLSLAGLLLGRKGHWLNSLCFAAFVLALWDPSVMLGLSFQLSFIAVLFIGFAIEKKREDDENATRTPLRFLTNPLLLATAASVGTAPLVAYYFHSVSLISPLSNLLVTPLIGFVLVPLSLFSSFTFLVLGWYPFSSIVGAVAGLSVHLVKFAARIPYASLNVPAFPAAVCLAFYIGFLVYILRGRPKGLLVLPFLPLLLYMALHAPGEKGLQVTFLDVGQGDSAVAELPDGRTLVIDTGRTGREAADYLKFRGIEKIDALVLTHVHPDHCGGFRYLLERFEVREIWDNGLIEYPEDMINGIVHRSLARGDILESGHAGIEVLHPYQGYHPLSDSPYEGENDSSLVLRVKGRRNSVLFAGDIESDAEEDMLHLGRRLRSDVLKVPHHGSRTSAGQDLISTVSPSAAVISVGRDNTFGHPSPDVIERLGGISVFRTDQDGAVKVTETADGPVVKTSRNYSFQKAANVVDEWENIKRLFVSW